MAEFEDSLRNLLNANSELSSFRKNQEQIYENFVSWKNALDMFYREQKRSKDLSEEEKKELEAKYKIFKDNLDIEEKILNARRKSIKTIQEENAVKKVDLQNHIRTLEVEKELTKNIESRRRIEGVLSDTRRELSILNERDAKLEKDKELSANKIFNLSKAYKDMWSNITKEKRAQAQLDKDALLDLHKRQAAGEDISDAQFEQARLRASNSANQAELADQLETIMNNVSNKISSLLSSIDGKIKDAINVYSDNFGKVDARLQTINNNTAKTYDSIVDATRTTIGSSTYVDYKKYMEVVGQLSAQGISYNIEERAFLETVSDKMVASFNVLDASLLRMTRLQQADMTRLMLGNEATLTRLFNEFFEDSSYLATNVSDNISSAVFDAASTMNSAAASAFEFTVQKWLGALYEVGVSQETVSSLASAINALGSGNAQAFMSSPVAVLLNMAIARGDYSLSDVLTQGLNTEFIDDIMKSMITLLTDIKDNTSNQVTLQAYSNVMGMSMADLRGFTNLKESDIAALSGYNQTAEESNQAVQQQINMLASRTTLKEQVDNALNNFMFNRGIALAGDNINYAAYIIGDLVEGIAKGTTIGLLGSVDKTVALLTAKSMRNEWASETDKTNSGLISKLTSGLVDSYDQLRSTIESIGRPGSLIKALSGSPYVRNERGADFFGVSPSYGEYYGKVSSGTSSSSTYQTINSSESEYAINAPSFSSDISTQQKIDNLVNNEEKIFENAISQESAEAMLWEVTLTDFYKELFIEHNFPIWIDFAPDTLSFLDKWYSTISKNEENIHARQHDTHVTNTVNVSGSVDISGGYGVNSIISAVRSGGF